MTLRPVFLLVAAGLSLAACDRRPEPRFGDQDRPSRAAIDDGQAAADNVLAAAAGDADRMRIAALENQLAELKAKVDTSDTAVLEARIEAVEAKVGSQSSGIAAPGRIKPSSSSLTLPTDDTGDPR